MIRPRRIAVLLILLFFIPVRPAPAKDANSQWLPISAEDKAVKDCPGDPGCSAMILYRQVINDNVMTNWSEYYRIKIFTDAGKKYADVQIPFDKTIDESVDNIAARTIQPDGKIVNFDGEVFEKVIVKGKNTKVLVKAFTLPGVQAGSIIEYRYTVRWGSGKPLITITPSLRAYLTSLGTETATHWDVQEELYTRQAHFSFHPIAARVLWTWRGLPPGVSPREQSDGSIVLDLRDIPALKEEEYMPPRRMVGARVDFFYVFSTYKNESATSSQWFWDQEGKEHGDDMENFIGKRKAVERAVEELVSPSDSPEARLRKIYGRVQQIRNLRFERSKTEKEEQREKLKDNKDVADVLKHGYGYGIEINALFAAMARAAGYDAYILDLASRASHVFTPALLNWSQLDANVVEVHAGSKTLYFDPATKFCPYGYLPWQESEANGIRLEDGRGVFDSTPSPHSSDAVTTRAATLQLGADGSLEGSVKATFFGQEALSRRLDNRDADDTGKRKALEDEVKGWLPAGSTVELKSAPDWGSSRETLEAEFAVKIPGFATPTGHRLLFPPAVFEAAAKYPFQTSRRADPVYFQYPFQQIDDVTIQPPPGWSIESLPSEKTEATNFSFYQVKYGTHSGALHFSRKLEMARFIFPVNEYPAIRVFYDKARAGDEQQAVLKLDTVAQAK
jgi:hypothetical protein